jgi:hypothetical protein
MHPDDKCSFCEREGIAFCPDCGRWTCETLECLHKCPWREQRPARIEMDSRERAAARGDRLRQEAKEEG